MRNLAEKLEELSALSSSKTSSAVPTGVNTARDIRQALRRVKWVSGITVGFSPWIYAGVMLFFHSVGKYQGFGSLAISLNSPLLWINVVACIVSLPTAWGVQELLARRISLNSVTQSALATNLSAVGIVSLTIVHTPAVTALVYYIFMANLGVALLLELIAFLLYIPLQMHIARRIRSLSHE